MATTMEKVQTLDFAAVMLDSTGFDIMERYEKAVEMIMDGEFSARRADRTLACYAGDLRIAADEVTWFSQARKREFLDLIASTGY